MKSQPSIIIARASAASATAPVKLLDVTDVASLLGCSPRHVQRLSQSGRMPPPFKLGQLVRWDHKRLMVWIEEGCPEVER
jgi:predicted DNA-binding transcriptional regulator AlpA